ncbi:SusC/RagA family TonB-linked outer membrane protein [Parabacteroides chinchillae]|uniref:TonB-linked outer membrane protein, SusC/RagA family n=1 Tax=Parabacteroides chinchillae TaxID=871327 RepID=A0A8G2BXY3_9BACT|nr:TonB-dependent receptor [Parabacteroides chinchillae]SEG04461.1 TonB-linked outer membrane protein, SusC/RagA family [Parabacteroides chinchillae]
MKRLTYLLLCLMLGIGLATAQTTKITGTVISAEDSEPIIGASVMVKGTTTGTVTDYDGAFTLNVPSSAKTLVVSYVGMEMKELPIQPHMKIVLNSSSQALDEVMVVAYGTTTKKSFTGSASAVKADDIKQIQSATITNALDGRAAGVQIVSKTGQPGENPTVRIRGIGSINAGKDPLYIVDGATYDGPISTLNSADIESMTVLKDAAANSLYGARGANGVILITTKRGNKTKLGINLDMKWGVNSRSVPEYDMITDRSVYYEQSWKAQYNKLIATGMSPSDVVSTLGSDDPANSLQAILGGYNNYNVPWSELIGADGKINPNARLLYTDDWSDALFRNSLRQEYNFSLGGSDDKQTYFISLGYLGDESYAKGSGFDRYSGRVRYERNLTKWLKAGANLAYAHTIQNYPTTSGGSYVNYFQWTRNIAPIYPVYLHDPKTGAIIKDKNGKDIYDYGDQGQYGYSRPYAGASNPAGVLDYDVNRITLDNVSASAFLEAEVYDGLSIRGNFDVNTTYKNGAYLTNPLYGDAAANGGYVEQENQKWFSYTGSVFLNYRKTFDKLSVEGMGGIESYKKEWNYLYGQKRNLATISAPDFSNAVVYAELSSYLKKYSVTGILFRANLSYDDKYYLSASFRRDGSSRFHPDNRWGNFGSVGVSWRLGQEGFLQDASSWLNDLKIKASIGTQGNDNLYYANGTDINYIPYMDQYEVANNNGNVSVKQYYVGNKDISWEKNLNFNIGFETTMWDRFHFNLEYFYKKTTDMLFYKPVAVSIGISTLLVNLGKMSNKGIEIETDVDIIKTRDWRWNVGLNFTHVKNTILELPAENRKEGILGQGYTKMVEGGSIYDLYLPEYAGLDENGKAMWNVYNEDGTLKGTSIVNSDAYTNTSRRKVGCAIPDLTGGLSTSLSWKDIDLSALFSYQIGGDVYDAIYASTMQMRESGRGMHKDLLNAWTPTNTNTSVPVMLMGYKDANGISDLYLTNASFFNIRNITLGYSLPKKWLRTLTIDKLRVYFAGDNLALFSHRKGLDPRQYDYGTSEFNYSPIRTISFGINVTL